MKVAIPVLGFEKMITNPNQYLAHFMANFFVMNNYSSNYFTKNIASIKDIITNYTGDDSDLAMTIANEIDKHLKLRFPAVKIDVAIDSTDITYDVIISCSVQDADGTLATLNGNYPINKETLEYFGDIFNELYK